MARLDRDSARELADSWGFPLDVDFHTLDSIMVARVIAAADSRGYRKPKSANGSRARYFYAYLRRTAQLN